MGVPTSTLNLDQNVIAINYDYQSLNPRPFYQTFGFIIYLSNQVVTCWGPEQRQTFPSPVMVTNGISKNMGKQTLKLFISDESDTNLLSQISKEGSADAKTLKSPPSMEFEANIFAKRTDIKSNLFEHTIEVELLSKLTSAQLLDLTQNDNNYGRRLLIVVRDRVIAAPIIESSIPTMSFTFKVMNTDVLTNFLNH